jgi:hypothetical protein
MRCYNCEAEVNWLADDSRCGNCTRLTVGEIVGLPQGNEVIDNVITYDDLIDYHHKALALAWEEAQ